EERFLILDALDGLNEFFFQGIFQEISAGAAFNGFDDVALVAVHTQDQHGRARAVPQNLDCSLDSVEAAHANIDDGHIRLELLGQFDRFQTGGRLGDNDETRVALEYPPQPLAHQGVIVGQLHANHMHFTLSFRGCSLPSQQMGTRRVTRHPRPGDEPRSRVPPSRAALSRIPTIPSPLPEAPAVSVSNPRPSSSISTVICSSDRRNESFTRVAAACVSQLWSASCTTR